MIRASLTGQIRQTRLPEWKPLLPVFEAVMNSYQAIQERGGEGGEITITLERASELELGQEPRVKTFIVTDNGAGFDDDNMESFNTAYSERKYNRGGKGLGRFLWLKAFEFVDVRSVFADSDTGERWARTFRFDTSYEPEKVSLENLSETSADRALAPGTTVRLTNLMQPYSNHCTTSAEHIAYRLAEHFILVLLHPDCPRIRVRDGSTFLSVNSIFETQFKQSAGVGEYVIEDTQFKVHGFRLTEPRSSKHRLIYCAHDRAVLAENLDAFLPNFSSRLTDENGQTFIYLAVVTSSYLDSHVNNERTAFDIKELEEAEEEPGLFPALIKRSDIRDGALKFIQADLSAVMADLNQSKIDKIVRYVETEAPHYKILLRRLGEFIDGIPLGGSRNDLEAALHRELHRREVAVRREGRSIIEGAKLKNYEEYKEKISGFIKDQNELGVAALAQYVAHRKVILELLKKALSVVPGDDKYPLERVVHDIIFPMQSTSDDILYSQQNLWLVDEGLNYHSFVSSDKRISQVNVGSKSASRPDILVFDRKFALTEGPKPLTNLTVIEFKRPMRDDYSETENPLRQVVKVVQDIRNGEALDDDGRPIRTASPDIPTNCYVICDITPNLLKVLQDWDATRTPDGLGYFGYHRTYKMYYEVMEYEKILKDAERRNRSFFERLNLL